MVRLAAASLGLALTACGSTDAPRMAERGTGPVEQSPAARQSAVPVSDNAAVAGEWDVVSFEGHQPRRLSGTVRAAFADFGERGVRLRIECNYSGRSGTVKDGRFVASDSSGAMQTQMGCGPEREARDSRFFSFFQQNPTIERVGADRLRLRAEGSELILERPAVRRLRFAPTPAELQGKWRMVEVTRYLPGGGFSGSGLSEVPGRIVIAGDRLIYSRCPQYGLTFRLGQSGRLEKTGGADLPASLPDCAELSQPAPASAMPAPVDVLRLLHANPAVERTDGNSLVLSTDDHALFITKAACESLEQSNDHKSSWVRDCASPE